MTYTLTANIPQPARAEEQREDMFLEEQYWGHRLWDAQSPWLTFLEFLGVAQSAFADGQLFDIGKSQYPSMYKARGRIYLRNILFNNEQLISRIAQTYGDSDTAWRRWLTWIEGNARGLDQTQRSFGYLRSRFDSFQEFAALVQSLRSCVVEGDRNKRWSSRFLFPFGPAAIFEDLDIKDDAPKRDYVNFGRSGELLYLMLARSRQRAELAAAFPKRLMEESNKWNQLIARLQPEGPGYEARRGQATYLPYDAHPVFDLIAADWLALLRLRLPGFDVVPYLVTSSAFGLLLYQLHTSAHVLSKSRIPAMICEIVAQRKGLVREVSIESFDENCLLSVEAMDRLIDNALRDPRWDAAATPMEKLNNRRGVLHDLFRWSDDSQAADADDLLKIFRHDARTRHMQHFGQVHRAYGRGIGLVSRRATTRFRYAPTDQFLKFLVFACVERRVEFGEFLSRIYARYGLVFGELEAENARQGERIDRKPFQQNALRLEHRLSSLGLLKRLSDACAYVENPYAD